MFSIVAVKEFKTHYSCKTFVVVDVGVLMYSLCEIKNIMNGLSFVALFESIYFKIMYFFADSNNVLVVPFKVLQQLDEFKQNFRAREAIRYINTELQAENPRIIGNSIGIIFFLCYMHFIYSCKPVILTMYKF